MRHLTLFLSAVLAISPLTAQSNDDDEFGQLFDLSLEELMQFEVVTPTRTKVELGSAPGSVTVITRDQIRRSPAQSIPELLRGVPGLNVRWNPMVQTIDVRAFGSNPFTSRVLLLIDGVPYNSWNKGGFPQHPGFDFFNLEYVHHIEVLRGPGSALYGENAFNAVINIVTLAGDDVQVDRVRILEGDLNTRKLSVTQGWQWGEDSKLFLGARQFEGTMPMELWEDYSDGTTSGYDLFAKLNWRDFEFTYYRIDDSIDGFFEPFGGGFLGGRAFLSNDEVEQTINIVSAKYSHQSEDGRWGTTIHATRAERDGSHCGACHARAQDPAYSSTADHGFQNYVEAHVNFNVNDQHSLLTGVEYRKLDSGEHTSPLPPSPEGRVLEYDKTALFLQDHVQVNEKLQIIAGLRYDGATSPDLYDGEVFPRLDAVYQLNEDVTLRAQWGEAARYPSFSELYQSNWFIAAEAPAGPPIVLSSFIPNPDLGPEYITTFTLGAEAMISGESRVRLDLFRNVIEDYITIAYPRIRFENHPQDAIVTGVEAEWIWEPSPTWSLSANYSYQGNKRKGNGVDSAGSEIAFTYAPRNKVNVGLDYRPSEDLDIRIDVHWKDTYRAPDFWYPIVLGGPPEDLDGFALANVRVDYRLPFKVDARKPFLLSLVAKNLGNERPHETLIGASARYTGRETFVQLEYQFQ